jgi:TetR/AcrR family transcriptional repressor of nem operon
MVTTAQSAARLTTKGQRTRTRIIDAAAEVIHERGVAGTLIEDVKAAAGVSSSQLYHYFTDKDDLVEAVIDHQADAVVHTQQRSDFATADGLRAWRDLIITEAGRTDGQGGCPLGSLGGQLAEADPAARTRVAAGFARWSDASGQLPRGTNPEDLAVTFLAALQGGLLLAQIHRDTRPLETTLDTLLALTASTPDVPAPRDPAG